VNAVEHLTRYIMPGFQHYVSVVPEPFCRCRPAVAGVRFRFMNEQWNYGNHFPYFRNDECKAKTVAVLDVASTEEIQAAQTSILEQICCSRSEFGEFNPRDLIQIK